MEAAAGRLQPWCFSVKLAKFLRTPILKNIYGRVRLYRGCGCDLDVVKRIRTNAPVKFKNTSSQGKNRLGPINLTGNFFDEAIPLKVST